MEDLNKLRKEIDNIDANLLPLFLKRMECSQKVADYKRLNNIPIMDKVRETEILNSKTSMAPPAFKKSVYDFFSGIMRISRIAQANEIEASKSRPSFLEGFYEENLKTNPVVAYQGIPGSNSESALIKFFGNQVKTTNVMTFDEVLDALENGDADYGVLPIENSSTGSILASLELLEKRNFYIIGEEAINIDHCLVGLKGAELRDIKKVYSHEQGFMQCKDFLNKHPKMSFEPYHNTAMAAKLISGLGDKSFAAIADRRAAELYGLDVLAEDISSVKVNITRFIIVAKNGLLNQNYNKISILFTLPNKVGSLSQVLSAFADNSLNMVKIESRPIHDKEFEYMFFVDLEGNLLNSDLQKIFTELTQAASSLRILGNYLSA